MTHRDAFQALPELRGVRITEDEHGNVCLNDLWRAAGSPRDRRPTDWRRSKRATALEAALRDRIVENLHHFPETSVITTLYTTGKGRGSRSFAHPVLALDYAEFLKPELGVEVKEVFLRYRANDIGIANDIMERIAAQVEEDDRRIKNRVEQTLRSRP